MSSVTDNPLSDEMNIVATNLIKNGLADNQNDPAQKPFFKSTSNDPPSTLSGYPKPTQMITVLDNKTNAVLGDRIAWDDADTFHIFNGDTRVKTVRFEGIDAYELSHKDGVTPDSGAAAQSAITAALVSSAANKGYSIAIDTSGYSYGRSVAAVLIRDNDGNKADLCSIQVRNGIAERAERQFKNKTRYLGNRDYSRDEEIASKNKSGIYDPKFKAQKDKENSTIKQKRKSQYGDEYTFNSLKGQPNFDLNLPENANKFKIGDVWLEIPPTHVSISQLRNSEMVDIIGFESKPISNPTSRIIIKTNLVFSGSKINQQLKRILLQFRWCPFNTLRSKDLWEKLSASEIIQAKDTLFSPYSQNYVIPITMDEYTIYSIEGHPELIGCSIQFSLFNYIPYYRGEKDKYFSYFKYTTQTVKDTNNLDDIIKPTIHLEDSTASYNVIVEQEINKNLFNFYKDEPSKIVLNKVDKNVSLKDLPAKEQIDGYLDDDGVIEVIADSTITETAHSISIAFRNKFGWQPIIGHSVPTAQYLGPGDEYISINIKTNNSNNIAMLLKTYHDTIKNNDYGFYDDRYTLYSQLTNFANTKVASISDVVITSLEGKPGWSDINITMNRSSFEYSAGYNDPIIEYDEYWGLGRVAKLITDPVAIDLTKKSSDNVKGTLLLDQLRKTQGVNVSGMAPEARAAIEEELQRIISNNKKEGEQFLKDNIIITSAKTESEVGNGAAIRDFINRFPKKYELKTDQIRSEVNVRVGTYKDAAYNNNGTLYKEARERTEKIVDTQLLNQQGTFPFGRGTSWNVSLLKKAREEVESLKTLKSLDDSQLTILANTYMTKTAQYKGDGTVIYLKYEPTTTSTMKLNSFREWFITENRAFSGDPQKRFNLQVNDGSNKSTPFDIAYVRYVSDSEKIHKDEVDKSKADSARLAEDSKKDLTKALDLAKPFAAHRYWPDVDKLVMINPLNSATVGSWYYTNCLSTMPQILAELQGEVSDIISPLQDTVAWSSVYMKEVHGGLFKTIQTSDSPMAILESIVKPITKREIDDEGKKLVNSDGKLVKPQPDAGKNNGSSAYPLSTICTAAFQTGYRGNDKTNDAIIAQMKTWTQNSNSLKWASQEEKNYIKGKTDIASVYNNSRFRFGIMNEAGEILPPSNTSSRNHFSVLKIGNTSNEIVDGKEGVTGKQTLATQLFPLTSFTLGMKKDPKGAALALRNTKNVESLNNVFVTQPSSDTTVPTSSTTGPTKEAQKALDQSKAEEKYIAKEVTSSFMSGLLPTGGMENAFPTYKMYIISSDTSDLRFYSLDDYFDFRLVQDVMVIRDKNNPVHILKSRIVIDPRYVTTYSKVNQKALDELNSEYREDYKKVDDIRKLDVSTNNKWDAGRLPLREGMRICLKLGYHSDPRILDTVFIGTIVSLNGRAEMGIFDLEAHGDGRELTSPAVNTTENLNGTNFANIISHILRTNTNVLHFGKVYGTFLERFSKKHHALLQLTKDCILPTGLLVGGLAATAFFPPLRMLQKVNIWKKGAVGFGAVLATGSFRDSLAATVNDEIPRKLSDVTFRMDAEAEARWSGMTEYFKGSTFDSTKANRQLSTIFFDTFYADQNPVDDNIYAIDIWDTFWARNFSLKINANKSIWNVLQTINRMYGGLFALDVRPYGNRSTVYLGHLAWDYWRTDDPLQAMAPSLGYKSGNWALNDDQQALMNDISGKVTRNGRKEDAGYLANRVPFQKQHVVTTSDIIVNSVKSTPSRGWNAVTIRYSLDAAAKDKGDGDIITKTADADLDPGALRMHYEDIDFTSDKQMAEWYALGVLKEGVEKLYGGTLILKGNPKIEPYDKIYIADDINKMFGWIQVESVIHKFDSHMGFTTYVVPNMVCSVNDDAWQSTGQIARKYLWNNKSKLGWTAASFAIGAAGLLLPVSGFIIAGASIALAMGECYWEVSQANNKDSATEGSVTTPYREEVKSNMDYIGAVHNMRRNLEASTYGMYLTLVRDFALGTWKYKNDGLEKDFNKVMSATKKAYFSYAEAKSDFLGSDGKNLFETFRGKGKDILKNSPKSMVKLTKGFSSTITKVSKLGKGWFALNLLSTFADMIPFAVETFAVKATKGNDAIVISPIISKGQLMMAGLEGYRNNDTWMHLDHQITNVKKNIASALDELNGNYRDAVPKDIELGLAEGKSYDPTTDKSRSQSSKISDKELRALDSGPKAEGIKQLLLQKLQKANGNVAGQQVFDWIIKENRKYNLNYDLIYTTIQKESGFIVDIKGKADPMDMGLFQVNGKYHWSQVGVGSLSGWSDVQRNPAKYRESLIKEGMSYLNSCYKKSTSKMTSYDNATNKQQASYLLTYAYYNGGENEYPKVYRTGDYLNVYSSGSSKSPDVNTNVSGFNIMLTNLTNSNEIPKISTPTTEITISQLATPSTRSKYGI